jgi:hypothetical protein
VSDVLASLTPAELDEVNTTLSDLRARGYQVRESFNDLAPGVRVRHIGHQWPGARQNGTGTVVVVTERNPSSWSQTWNAADIEMVVAYDNPAVTGSRLVTVAQYHVEAVAR